MPGRCEVNLAVTKPYRLQLRTVLGSSVPSNLASTVPTPEKKKKNHLEGYSLILKLIFKGRVCGCDLNSSGYKESCFTHFENGLTGYLSVLRRLALMELVN